MRILPILAGLGAAWFFWNQHVEKQQSKATVDPAGLLLDDDLHIPTQIGDDIPAPLPQPIVGVEV